MSALRELQAIGRRVPGRQVMPKTQQLCLISSLPPSPAHKRAALAVSTLLLAAFVITVPSARVVLPQLDIYIPLVATVMFLNDLMTASLLLAQFSIVRSRALLWLQSNLCEARNSRGAFAAFKLSVARSTEGRTQEPRPLCLL